MAFFRKSKKKKENAIPEENKIPSAEIAKQRAEDIQSNYDGDDFSNDSFNREDDFSTGEELPEGNNGPEDLDSLLSGDLDNNMLSFDEDVEKDIEKTEDAVEAESNDEHDFFADVELPDDTSGELSATDQSFEGLYSMDGDDLSEAPNEVPSEIPSASEVAESEDTISALAEDDNSDLAQSLSDDIEEQLIEKEEEHASPDGMASKSQIYMAMQVFDSETGDFDMRGVDNQLVFDTDDEDSFEFSCYKDEEDKPEEIDSNSYVFDTSEEE